MVATKEPKTVPQNTAAKARRPGFALAIIAIAQLMIVLDATVVNVALPTIQKQLNFSPVDLEWIVNGYAVTFGGLLLLGGRAGDIFGRRRMFAFGIGLFTLASFFGGIAQSEIWLIIARIVQGVGGAIIAPASLSLLAETFPEGPGRNRAFGVYGAVAGAGGSLGLLLGGVITQLASWRWVFFINLFIGALVLLALRSAIAPSQKRAGQLDLAGGLTVTAAVMSLVYGLARAGTYHFSDTQVIVFLALAGVFLLAFLIIEARSKQPLMPFQIFTNRNRSAAYAQSLVVSAALFSVFFFLTLFVQQILGYDPLKAGLGFLPLSFGITIVSILISQIVAKTGPRWPMSAGALVAAGGLFYMSMITPSSTYFSAVLGPSIVMAIGLGLLFVPLSLSAVAAIRPEQAGLASALLNTSQQIGGALGLAIMVNVATAVTSSQLQAGIARAQAVTAGYSRAFLVAVGIDLLAFLIAIIFIRTRPAKPWMLAKPEY